MASEIVIALYKPKAGKADQLEALVDRHEPLLRQEGLVTDRPFVKMRSGEDGTILEVFEWVSADAAGQAHTNASIGPLWGEMTEVATFSVLAELLESTKPFPHFIPM